MEQYELDLIEKFQGRDAELKTLWENHQAYERMLERLESKPYRTPAEAMEIKEIKKKKLAGKTRIDAILTKYRKAEE